QQKDGAAAALVGASLLRHRSCLLGRAGTRRSRAWRSANPGTRESRFPGGGRSMDFGLLILRVVVGALFIGHGTQKLFGWFEGHGLEGTAGFMHSLGYRPGKRYAAIGGLAEAGGGLLLVLGLLTPLAAVLIVGMMLNAILSVHLENGVWATNGGYE